MREKEGNRGSGEAETKKHRSRETGRVRKRDEKGNKTGWNEACMQVQHMHTVLQHMPGLTASQWLLVSLSAPWPRAHRLRMMSGTSMPATRNNCAPSDSVSRPRRMSSSTMPRMACGGASKGADADADARGHGWVPNAKCSMEGE